MAVQWVLSKLEGFVTSDPLYQMCYGNEPFREQTKAYLASWVPFLLLENLFSSQASSVDITKPWSERSVSQIALEGLKKIGTYGALIFVAQRVYNLVASSSLTKGGLGKAVVLATYQTIARQFIAQAIKSVFFSKPEYTLAHTRKEWEDFFKTYSVFPKQGTLQDNIDEKALILSKDILTLIDKTIMYLSIQDPAQGLNVNGNLSLLQAQSTCISRILALPKQDFNLRAYKQMEALFTGFNGLEEGLSLELKILLGRLKKQEGYLKEINEKLKGVNSKIVKLNAALINQSLSQNKQHWMSGTLAGDFILPRLPFNIYSSRIFLGSPILAHIVYHPFVIAEEILKNKFYFPAEFMRDLPTISDAKEAVAPLQELYQKLLEPAIPYLGSAAEETGQALQ